MLKNYNYMLTILLYPFIFLLSYLKLANVVKGNWYYYLIVFMVIIFIPSFIMSLYSALEEILNSKKKWRIIPLVLLSIIYLPIYYTKYIAKEEKYLGYLLFIIAIPLTILTINSFNKKLFTYFKNSHDDSNTITFKYIYTSSNQLFSIDIDSSFRCKIKDIGDYVAYCSRIDDDSFIGIYSYDISYDNEEEIKEKLDFHINQTIDYIKDSGYEYELNDEQDIIRIDYDDNTILITQKNYFIGDIKYSLIILKEMPKEYISYEEYEKMIDSIKFLNYNEGVSS